MTLPLIQNKPDYLYPLFAIFISLLIAFIIGQISAGLAAGIVLGAIVAIIGLAQYEALIHAMIILLPMQSALPVSLQSLGTFNPFNLLAGVMFAVWLVNGVIRQEKLLNRCWMNVVVALFIAVCVAALFNSGRLYGAGFMEAQINPLKRWISPMLLFFPIANSRLARPALKRLVLTATCMILVVAVWMVKDIYNVGWQNISTETRLGGPFGFGGENDIAAFLVFYPVIALTIALFESKLTVRIFLLSVFCIAMFPLILSMSRGAYLGMAAVIVFIGVMRFRWLLPIVLLAALSYRLWVPGAVQQRLDSTIISSNETVGGRAPGPHEMERNLEESAAQRVRIWRGAIRIIENKPVAGVGYNAFQTAIPKYANMAWGMDAHNMYLRVAAEMGIGGFAVFLLLFIVPFSSSWAIYKSSKNRFIQGWMLGMMACICGILMVNFFGSRFLREELVGLYWVLVALMYGYIFLRRNRSERMKMRASEIS